MEQELKTVCKNPWCKSTFLYKDSDMIPIETDKRMSNLDNVLGEIPMMPPPVCPKCKSFDTELSGGVNWKTKDYEGPRFDGVPHEFRYKVTNYRL